MKGKQKNVNMNALVLAKDQPFIAEISISILYSLTRLKQLWFKIQAVNVKIFAQYTKHIFLVISSILSFSLSSSLSHSHTHSFIFVSHLFCSKLIGVWNILYFGTCKKLHINVKKHGVNSKCYSFRIICVTFLQTCVIHTV